LRKDSGIEICRNTNHRNKHFDCFDRKIKLQEELTSGKALSSIKD